MTIASIAAQAEVAIECIVVEQSAESLLAKALPPWVRYVHTPPPRPGMPYSRSWAFNVGARFAKGQWLVLHDNDLLVPSLYAFRITQTGLCGFDAARLQRFVFYLSKEGTDALLASPRALFRTPPVRVVQNCEGGTLAVRRSVYWEIGAHDEGFEGWGGEDNELFDRLLTRRLHDHSYLPFVHLYHALQVPQSANNAVDTYFDQRMRIPAPLRIAELAARPSGQPSGPASHSGARADPPPTRPEAPNGCREASSL
jgi:glycosyltransferase involved in cell wall biosynthesis